MKNIKNLTTVFYNMKNIIKFTALNFIVTSISFSAFATPPATIWNPTFAMCAVYSYAAGPIGKTLALLCLVMIGISFFMSKVSWTTALSVALGISAIFGAPTIVNLLTGGGGDGCATAKGSGSVDAAWNTGETYQFGSTTAVPTS